jgi:UDP-GlcNAc:undecaprenyl-phosphate GlcNAc-1-phosphate transferase
MMLIGGSFVGSVVATLGMIAFNIMKRSLKEEMVDKPVAKSGGAAIMFPVIVAWLFELGVGMGLLLLILATVFGIFSDFKKLKVGWHIIAVLVMGLMTGFGGFSLAFTDFSTVNGLLTLIFFGVVVLGAHLANTFEGQLAGYAAISGVGIYMSQGITEDLALVLAVSSLGFLFFNLYPAKIQIGASGCYGIVMIWMLLLSKEMPLIEGSLSEFYPIILLSLVWFEGIIGLIRFKSEGVLEFFDMEGSINSYLNTKFYLPARTNVYIYLGIGLILIALSTLFVFVPWVVRAIIMAIVFALFVAGGLRLFEVY